VDFRAAAAWRLPGGPAVADRRGRRDALATLRRRRGRGSNPAMFQLSFASCLGGEVGLLFDRGWKRHGFPRRRHAVPRKSQRRGMCAALWRLPGEAAALDARWRCGGPADLMQAGLKRPAPALENGRVGETRRWVQASNCAPQPRQRFEFGSTGWPHAEQV